MRHYRVVGPVDIAKLTYGYSYASDIQDSHRFSVDIKYLLTSAHEAVG